MHDSVIVLCPLCQGEGRPAERDEGAANARPAERDAAEQPALESSHADSKTRKADRRKSSAPQPAIGASHASRTRMQPTCSSNVTLTPAPHASRSGNKTCKADRGQSSAAQPASGVSDGTKQFQGDRCLACVAYVKIPTFARWGAMKTGPITAGRSVVCTIKQIKVRGVDIINMVFERANDLEYLWYKHDMVATTSQMGFEHHKYDKLLTLRSTRCGRVLKYHDGVEDGTPGLMLHLEKGPHENLGDMIIVNVASRHLSSFGIRRHLDRLMAQGQYCDTFSHQKNSVSLIGGDVGESLFLDHYQERRNNGFHLFSGEMGSEISVFARADDEIEYSSYTMTDDADITVVQLWRSAKGVPFKDRPKVLIFVTKIFMNSGVDGFQEGAKVGVFYRK